MTQEQFRVEQTYLSALSMLNSLRDRALVTADEYDLALKILSDRYKPLIDASLIVSRT